MDGPGTADDEANELRLDVESDRGCNGEEGLLEVEEKRLEREGVVGLTPLFL